MFGTGMDITRQDMAVLIYKCLKTAKSEENYEEQADFIDADDIAEYAKNCVGYMKKFNIITGYEDKSFRPENTATRAEAAVILCKSDALAREVIENVE